MSIANAVFVWVGLLGMISSSVLAQTTKTILFDNTGAEAGITPPGTTDFSFEGANWSGGVVATEFTPALYASGQFAYEIGAAGGQVTFTEPMDSAAFFFVHPGGSFVPAPRGGAPGVWLGADRQILFFGGMLPITGDTVEYDANTGVWHELVVGPPGALPAERCHHSLVSDSTNANILMFGGFSFAGRFNDVWRFEPATAQWTEVFPSGVAPARRCLHAAAFDETHHQMLVYGGVHGGGVAAADYFEDTHLLELDTNTWTLVNAPGPGKLRGAVAFYSAAQDAVYLWGGKQVTTYPTTLWRFNVGLRTWEAVTTGGDVPLGREDPAIFWDESLQQLVLFSGRNDNLAEPLLSDFYILDLDTATWQVMPTTGLPAARWRATVVFDPATRTGFLFGGWRDFGGASAFDDTWQYDANGKVWSLAPVAGTGVATAFDSAGAVIGSVGSHLATVSADPNNFVTLNPATTIARVEFAGGIVDNFSYTAPVVIPTISSCGAGVMAFLLVGWGAMLVARRTDSRDGHPSTTKSR